MRPNKGNTGLVSPSSGNPEIKHNNDRWQSEIMHIAPNNLCVLSQVRSGPNGAQKELVESIESTGLVNPISVARVKPELLTEYIDFVNELWKSNHQLEDFSGQYEEIGRDYYIVMAGHSRLKAWGEIYGGEADVKCNVFTNISSPEDILRIQLAENIYQAPDPERRAQAVYEACMWAEKHGQSKEDYARENNISPRILKGAFDYARLPEGITKLVHEKQLSYTRALDIAQVIDEVYSISIATAELKEWDTEEKKIIGTQSIYERYMGILANEIKQARVGRVKAKNIIQSHLGMWNSLVSPEQPTLPFDNEDYAKYYENLVRGVKNQYRRSLERVVDEEGLLLLLEIHRRGFGAELPQSVLNKLDQLRAFAGEMVVQEEVDVDQLALM